jgi:uncharacterized membrane protein YbhN (UPF0104 family)
VELKRILRQTFKIVFPFILGGLILYWMYRDFDFSRFNRQFIESTNWWWMAISLVFGAAAQIFRGLRWRQTLEPLDEYPRRSTCIYSIFISYASSLIVPRIGEVARCGVLKRYEGTSFTKAVGTVVTERIIDTLLMLLMVLLTIVLQVKVFNTFFEETGTSIEGIFDRFTPTGWIVALICGAAALVFAVYLVRKMTVLAKFRKMLVDMKEGVLSLKGVRNKGLFVFYTLMIWASYYVHFYLTFRCFDFMDGLGPVCALVAFTVGTISVIVPTPNGAGPWHFSVKTILCLYGVGVDDAVMFVLVVHAIQTALVPVLGVYALIMLYFTKRKVEASEKESITSTNN